MAKRNSKGSDKAKQERKAKDRADVVIAADDDTSKLPRRYRKQLRILERALADAAKLESRRLLKLERARYRRQMIEAVLEELRPETAAEAEKSAAPAAVAKPAAKPVARPATQPTAAAPAVKAPAAAKPAARPRTARPAATARRTAPKPPAAPPATDKP